MIGCFLCLTAFRPLAAAPPARPVLVIAHRGAHQQHPENSLPAIRAAAKLGCDYVEVDVRMTRDGKLVLMHDSTVDRTTRGSGKVRDMALSDVRELRFSGLATDDTVPTFDEAVAACKSAGIGVYVDHKVASPDSVAKVLATVDKHGMRNRIVVYSSNQILHEYKRLSSDVWIMPPHPRSSEAIREIAVGLKPETLDGNLRDWTDEEVQAAHSVGIQVWVDNLGKHDNPVGFQKAVDMDVDAIQTDHPLQLIEFLALQARRKIDDN